jgi:hypothetical protein
VADQAALLEAIRSYLVSLGHVRLPTVAGTAPPLWLAPEGGAVAPGDKQGVENDPDLVLSVFHTGGIAGEPFYSWVRRDTVDIWLRCRKAPHAMEKEPQLRAAFVGDLGKRDWTMAGLHVVYSGEWRPLQPLYGAGGPGHAFVVSYYFEYPA